MASSRALSPLFALLLLSACAPAGSLSGKLTDPQGQPRANERLVAKATSGGDLTCQSREVTTGPDGAFSFTETCADHEYKIVAGDKSLALEGDLKFKGGEKIEAPREIKAWRTPKGDGVYVVANDQITEVRKASDTYWEPVFKVAGVVDNYEKARYPETMPKTIIGVPANGWLAIAGKDNVSVLKVLPLIPHNGPVTFPHLENGTTATITDAQWIGIQFKSDKVNSVADTERVEPAPDATKVKDLGGDEWSTRLIQGDALPPGKYAVLSEAGSRLYLVEFGGEAPAAPAKEAPAAPAEGGATPAAPAEGAKGG